MSKFKTMKLVSVFLVLSMVIALLVMPMQATFYEYHGGSHTESFSRYNATGSVQAGDVDIDAWTDATGNGDFTGVSVSLSFCSTLGGNTPYSVDDYNEGSVYATAHVSASDVIDTDYINPANGFTSCHTVYGNRGNKNESFYIGTSS